MQYLRTKIKMTSSNLRSWRRTVFCLFILAAIAALFALPYQMRTKASKGMIERTESHDPELPNYDIRSDKASWQKLAEFRSAQGRSASQVADVRDAFVRGEAALRDRIPTLKIEYNTDIRTPEVITPQAPLGRHFLTNATRPAGEPHADVLVDFLKQNTELVGAEARQIDALKVAADYTNPDGNLSFVELNQVVNGIPVFRGEVKAGFTRRGELVRVINNLAPGLDYSSLSTEFGDPMSAVRAAASLINSSPAKLDLRHDSSRSTEIKAVFGDGDFATTAEKMYFPTEPGVAIPAWRVLIWQPVNAFYVIVDANGTMLWRKNIVNDQTQAATYHVWTNPNAVINVADNPFPMTPGPATPNGMQGAAIPRVMVTRIGNEAPYTFNNLGWINDGNNQTDGNNLEAGLDRDTTNGVDPSNGRATGTNRTFDFPISPGDPNTNSGDSPVPAGEVVSPCASITQPHGMVDAQRAAITQLFYITNWYHDELYRLGFTEQARNFQHDNFNRGGTGGDRVSGEGQDCSGTNNANFGTGADGNRGRMQMYIWTGPTPDFDGDLDADVIVHEYTHGLSNRLHGNASGLATNMAGGMGEGWSDFYGHAMLSEPTDPINGIYTTGSYDTYRGAIGYVNNYYYGIRRFPKAVRAFTGGPNNRPHNPLTFADADQTQLNVSDGAFARGPFGVSTADQVHNLGEIWSSMLWEVRCRMVERLGWATGNRRAMQLVTDGMKMAPLGPTFIQERDAILAAGQAGGVDADVADIWAGFAVRGLGASATIQNPGSGSGDARVTESFDLPNLLQSPNLTISDAGGNGNTFPEPGETLTLTIPLSNNTGNTATGVTLGIAGGNSVNYGTINNNQTVSQQISYTIPANTACGSVITLTLNVNSSIGAVNFTRSFGVGQPATTYGEAFDSVTAPAFPAGWTAASVQGGINFVSTTNTPDSGANAAFAQDPSTVGGGTDLTSPATAITVPAATLSFRQKFDTEDGWDGGALEISIGGGAFQDIVTAGGTFLQNGYNSTLGNYTNANNPLGGRNAWSGNSGGYITTIVRLPAAAAGQNVQFKWRFGADNNTAAVGWWVDSVQVAGDFTCSSGGVRSRADFDGDGRTDLSVFRPSEGNWYMQRSTAGFIGVNFGISTDTPTPGDFDGDGKADIAVYRAGTWYRLNSSNGAFAAISFGNATDVPQAGDFDGDGKDDLAVFRPSDGTWYRLNSSNGAFVAQQFGQNGDVPVGGDYDGDSKDDVAVYRSGIWYRLNSTNGQFVATAFGNGTDLPTPADFDGDSREDIAVFRPSDGNWYRLNSSNGQFVAINFGITTDVPVPGDYDGDGRDDQAVYRGGTWYLNRSTSGFASVDFGVASDIPIPKKYIP